ncbi:ERBB receptor feedback inhibitor 1 isoform X1 [Alosa sapidissima]|uniref:ERBB receptor feedback inhibitor 1 isoform X1 n=2 Tax=Alosa sapidissima TaxID=34773 RepID=UPI001C08A771|nr:ERBB receptor feedback inhibitor 1 isoform X1 [Alosa sapidissima]XP_041953542.1 ERBB receptor feedback inhibitor 1 isoform X1 [Alosa sapidissima]
MEVCLSMATAKPFWDPHETNNLYFCLDAETMEQNFRTHYRDSSMGYEESSMPSYQEGDQVVPSFKRLSVYEPIPPHSSRRATKPLPPLPDPSDLSSDEGVDNEVEFFTSADDRQCLVPEHRPKALAFRYAAPGRRSYRGCGQVNYAYYEGAKSACTQGQEKLYAHKQPRELPLPRDCARQPDRPQRRLRRTHSGPAGSFKTASLRLFGHGQLQDKPEVPPRVPIPPLPAKSSELRHRWSALVPPAPPSDGDDDDDKPPQVPPREPIPRSYARTPSPKSLPIYVNGVMPPTQSFAPNPKYVSKAQPRAPHRAPHEAVTPSHNPCILPIMEDGKKASTTHYFLLPHRPAYLDRYARFFRETDCETTAEEGCS